MANKREFKKYVNAVCESIINDMMTAYYHVEEVDKTAVEAAVADILMATENAILKSGIKFDKTASAFDTEFAYHNAKRNFFKSLYRKINKEFSNNVNAAIKKFNAAIRASIKDANKANA